MESKDELETLIVDYSNTFVWEEDKDLVSKITGKLYEIGLLNLDATNKGKCKKLRLRFFGYYEMDFPRYISWVRYIEWYVGEEDNPDERIYLYEVWVYGEYGESYVADIYLFHNYIFIETKEDGFIFPLFKAKLIEGKNKKGSGKNGQ